jgi:hypothetical protein
MDTKKHEGTIYRDLPGRTGTSGRRVGCVWDVFAVGPTCPGKEKAVTGRGGVVLEVNLAYTGCRISQSSAVHKQLDGSYNQMLARPCLAMISDFEVTK